MLISKDNNYLNKKKLKQLCKNNKIKNYSKLKKNELFNEYNKHLSITLIQKVYRKHLYKNAIDHITLEPIFYPCFIFKTLSGKLYFYAYDSIIKYIMKSGNTNDPMTREKYSDKILRRLDLQVKKYFTKNKYKSTLKIKHSLTYSKRICNRENEILSFQMRIDEIKTSLFLVIDMIDWDISDILIRNVEYNNIEDYIHLLIHELKLLYHNLNIYDNNTAILYKKELLEYLSLYKDNLKINKVITKIINF